MAAFDMVSASPLYNRAIDSRFSDLSPFLWRFPAIPSPQQAVFSMSPLQTFDGRTNHLGFALFVEQSIEGLQRTPRLDVEEFGPLALDPVEALWQSPAISTRDIYYFYSMIYHIRP